MKIEKSIDIEDEVRKALSSYFTIYCLPLPKNFKTPSLLVKIVSGSGHKIDAYDVVLDARAKTPADAMDLLLEATATLKAVAHSQTTQLRYVIVNNTASWGTDPVRPELALCSARMQIFTHKIEKEI